MAKFGLTAKNKMAEFFLELFTEEIPANLQINARENLIINIKNFLDRENITYKGKSKSYSTPNRLVIYYENIDNCCSSG